MSVTAALSQGLYMRYLSKILDRMALPTDATSSWKKSDPSRVLFDSLCRRGGAACGENMATLVPAILVHLDSGRDADVRLAFLALLETMLGTDSIFKVRPLAYLCVEVIWYELTVLCFLYYVSRSSRSVHLSCSTASSRTLCGKVVGSLRRSGMYSLASSCRKGFWTRG